MLKFGIVSVFPPPRATLQYLRLAERLGFDTLWVNDSHLTAAESYSLLGWLVAKSEGQHIKLGTMVTNPASRDPIVVASAFATLQDLSQGRMLCGIGRGDSAVRVLRRRPATVAATEEATVIIKTLGAGLPMELDGAEVHIPWAAKERLPVYVAAYGPRMLEVAGRVGDGVIIECADPHYISWALEHVRRGSLSVGRDPTELAVICSTATYVSDLISKAREQVRPMGAVIGNHVAEVLRNSGPESMPKELAAFVANRPEYDYQQHIKQGQDHAKYVPDEILDRLCLIGTAAQCVQRLLELQTLGVTHVNFYTQSDEFEFQMETYARQIVPKLRSRVAS